MDLPQKTAPWLLVQERMWKKRQRIVGSVYGFLGLILIVWGSIIPFIDDAPIGPVTSLALGAVGLLHLVGGTAFALDRRWSRAIMWTISGLYLAAFPLGVLVGGYGLWVLYNTRESMEPPPKPAFAACCAGATLLVLLGISARYSDSSRSEFAERVQAAIESQGATVEMRAWFTAEGAETIQPAAIMQLAHRGILRLSTDDQLIHSRFVIYALGNASVADCAAYARGRATAAQQRALTQRLDSTWLKQGAEVAARAILAEIRQFPPAVPASENDIAEYLALVYDSLSSHDRQRFDAASASLSTVSDQDACWFGRLLLGQGLEQPGASMRWVPVVATLGSAQWE